jgi:nitronate monooxygenase
MERHLAIPHRFHAWRYQMVRPGFERLPEIRSAPTFVVAGASEPSGSTAFTTSHGDTPVPETMSGHSSWDRRQFLRAGVTVTAAAGLSTSTLAATSARSLRPRLHTPLCALLDIEYPILQSGMGGVGGTELAVAVSRAGGLGIIAGAHLPTEEIRNRIREVRSLTDRAFGVNLLLHSQMWPPVDAATIPEAVVLAAQRTLNRFRERLGLAPSLARPDTRPDYIPEALEVILEERVPVFSIGLGNPPPDLVERFHERGTKVIAMVATVDDALEVAASGVDALVVQGHEAGGHRSTWVKRASPEDAHIGTMTLVPQVAERVSVPVIAAGGISTGRGLAAALALGAGGVLMGTRFVATRESLAPGFYKQELVEQGSDDTTVTDAYTGLHARVLRNTFTRDYATAGAPVLLGYLQASAARDIFLEAAARQDPAYFPMWAGQGIGMIDDIPGAADVVEAVVREAHAVLEALPREVLLD